MQVLELRDFRNYENQLMEPLAGMNVVYGENGQGKSNLLEAVAWLAVGRSPRRAKEAEAIRFGTDGFRLRCKVAVRSGSVTRELAYGGNGSKRFSQDGMLLKRAKDMLGTMRMVHFAPEDLYLVKGSPDRRRRFLDLMIAQASTIYVSALSGYYRFLLQRNALLKEVRARKASSTLLAALEEGMAREGSRVLQERRKVLEEFAPLVEGAYRAVSGGRENLKLFYTPETPGGETELRAAMEKRRGEEVARGTSLIGPHRDDIVVHLEQREARVFSSQGQMRSVALALRLAERRWLKQRTGEEPILLLDDLPSELDLARRAAVLQLLQGEAQVFATCTTATDFPSAPEAAYFRVVSGKINRES